MIASLRGEEMEPVDLVVYGAYSTLKKAPSHILKRMDLEAGNVEKRRERLLNVTLESGHLSVLDQAVFTVYVSDIPRLSTLFMVQPLYLSHLQQSMRRVEPYGLTLPESLRGIGWLDSLLDQSLDLYYEMVNDGIPKEDARYVIPLYSSTNIQTVGNAREYTNLLLLSRQEGVPTITRRIVEEIINELRSVSGGLFKEYGENMNILKYYPPPNMFRFTRLVVDYLAEEGGYPRLIDYSIVYRPSREEVEEALRGDNTAILSVLRNNIYHILTKMSISTLHQFLRQRTLGHIPESIYHALERRDYVTPPSIQRSRYRERYREMVERLHNAYRRLVKEGIPREDAVGVVSHAHSVYDLVKVDGWNIIGAMPTRRCVKAQWEIRRVVGDMVFRIREVDPILPIYSLPGCIVFGKCPEKYPCEWKEEFESKGPLVSRPHTPTY